jgi:replication initiation and membrane attachment protein DnaB
MVTPIYFSYLVLIDCCMPTCICTHAKLSKTSFFSGQILNPKLSFFLGRREYVKNRKNFEVEFKFDRHFHYNQNCILSQIYETSSLLFCKYHK